MGNDKQLQYLIKVIDQASADITKITAEMQKLDTQNASGGASSAAMGGSMLQMAGAFGLATTAVGAVSQSVQFLQNQFEQSIKVANQYNSAFVGLSSVAAAFGQDQDKARLAAQSLAKDGLMSVSDAAMGLKNLLATHFNLDESIRLMGVLKDAAAFNRQGQLSFGEAVVGTTQGIKNQNSIMTDNGGITKNLSIMLEEAGFSQNDLMRVTTDASVRQALFNGFLKEGAVFAGDAARAADTLAGSQSQLDVATQKLHDTIGQSLAPALILFNQTMTGTVGAAKDSLIPVMAQIATTAVQITNAALIAGEALRSMVGLGSDITRSFDPNSFLIGAAKGENPLDVLKNNFDQATNEYQKFQDRTKAITENSNRILEKIQKDGVGKFGDVTRDAMDQAGDSIDKNGEKIAKKLEEIQQKIDDINKNILNETTAFTHNLANATADFDRQISDLVVKHKQAVTDLNAQMASLNSDFASASQDRLDTHTDKVDQIKQKYADETATLEDNLKRQAASSKTSDAQLLKYFQAQIAAKDAERDKEIADENTAYDKQTAKEKADEDKKLADIQTKLDAEMAIEKAHADDFAKFKDAVAEDDITRAEEQFKRQIDQMQYQHDLKMKELESELKDEQALKNKYMGTNVTTASTYTPSGTNFNQSNTKITTPSYVTPTIQFNQTNYNTPMNQTIKNALPIIGFLLK